MATAKTSSDLECASSARATFWSFRWAKAPPLLWNLPLADLRVASPARPGDRHLTRVVGLNPRHGDMYRTLALAYTIQRDIDQAISAPEAAVRLQLDARDLLCRLLAARAGR